MNEFMQCDFWKFSPDGREFEMSRRDLKTPWKNLVCTDFFHSEFSQTASGKSYGRHERHDRVTADDSSRAVWVKNDKGTCWTLNGTHGEQPRDWKCVHRPGSTTLSATVAGILGEMTFFPSRQTTAEFWKISLQNKTNSKQKLSLFPVVSWRVGFVPAFDDYGHIFEENGTLFGEAWFWSEDNVRSTFPHFNRPWDRIAFMSSSLPTVGTDLLPEKFYGACEDGVPDAVAAGACKNSSGRGGEICGVLQHEVTLAPGETLTFAVAVGVGETKENAASLACELASVERVEKEFEAVNSHWDEYLGRTTIETPDEGINAFANIWNRYFMDQRYYTRFGFRDTAQDMYGFIPFDAERVRSRIVELCGAQLPSGHAMHDILQLHFYSHISLNSDPAAWLPWLVANYIKETGDYSVLDEKAAFHGTDEMVDVYGHCVRAFDYFIKESGKFDLPFIKCGDWNDALMGANKTGVSIWLAEFLFMAFRDMAVVAENTGRDNDAKRFSERAELLKTTINEKCWDGEWYVRAFDDDGKVIGSSSNEEGKIFINTQTWATMAGIADKERACTALRAIERMVDTPMGLPMLAPSFTGPNYKIGQITCYPTGHHHNGVWHHANTWVMIAECMMGRPDRALELYMKIFPPRQSYVYDNNTSAPYAFGSWSDTQLSRFPGLADTNTNTGTCVWAYLALTEGFAGIRAEFDGLSINPSLPSDWDTLSVKRPYRKATLKINVRREGQGSEIKSFSLDGTIQESNLIPSDISEGSHIVDIVIG